MITPTYYRFSQTTNLILNGLKFHSTWSPEDKKDAVACKQRAAERGRTLILKNFGVAISTIDPKTNNVISWSKYKGCSLWEKVDREES